MSKYATDKPSAATLNGSEILQIVQAGLDKRVDIRRLRVGNIATYTVSQTAALGDDVMVMDSSSALVMTVPTNAAQAFPIGHVLELWQAGAGTVTIAPASGVTILKRSTVTLVMDGPNSGCSLRKVAVDTWRLIGEMVPTP